MAFGDWTQERIALLGQLWAAGISGAECATRINRQTNSQFSRSAILGTVFRLKLAAPIKKKNTKPRGPRPGAGIRSRPDGKQVNRDFRRAAPAQIPDTTPPWTSPSPRDVIPATKPFKVREREHFIADSCTYVDNCPHTPVRGRFFCEEHCAIVYRPSTPPRDPKPFHRQPSKRSSQW